MGNGRTWTQQEKDTLSDLYGTVSLDTIAKKLGRSVGAIINMRTRLKLGAFLDNCEYITLNQLLKVVKGCRTSGAGYALISWVQNRGLPIKHKRVNNNSFRVVLVDDFWKWAEKNKSFLDFSKMQEMILGAEPEWAKEKRLEDTLCKSIKKTSPWTALEDARLKAYVEAGEKTGHEIAQLLQRSYGAVARRCKDLGIGNPKRMTPHEHSWSSEEMMEVVQSVMDATPYSLIAARMDLSEKAIRGMMYRLYKTENQDKIRQIIKEG